MICEKAMALMSAKLDDALSPEEAEALAAHLAACPACNNLMQSLEGLDEQLAGLQEPAPAGLKEGVLNRIDKATRKINARGRWYHRPGNALGVVAAALVLMVGLGVVSLPRLAHKDMAAEMPLETQAPMECLPTGSAGMKGELHAPELYGIATEAPQNDGTGRGDAVKVPSATYSYQGHANWYASAEDLPGAGGWSNYEPVPDGSKTASGEDVSWYVPAPGQEGEVPPDASGEDLVVPAGESYGSKNRSVSKLDNLTCTTLSKAQNAAVLLYTEFSPESLFRVLEAEEQELYALVEHLEPVSEGGMICYETDCGTALAIQEWLVSQLPPVEENDPELREADTNLKSHMEALDPGSACLYRIITLSPGTKTISWPASWPENWADRFRIEENWRLYFPAEDYVPNAGNKAFLVFPEK